MIWILSNTSIIILAIAALIVASIPKQAQAQSARIESSVFKVGLIVGAGCGSGVHTYN